MFTAWEARKARKAKALETKKQKAAKEAELKRAADAKNAELKRAAEEEERLISTTKADVFKKWMWQHSPAHIRETERQKTEDYEGYHIVELIKLRKYFWDNEMTIHEQNAFLTFQRDESAKWQAQYAADNWKSKNRIYEKFLALDLYILEQLKNQRRGKIVKMIMEHEAYDFDDYFNTKKELLFVDLKF